MKSRHIKLKIGGMTCINCQNKIQSKLEKLDGVKKADVSWENGTALIEFYEEKISLEKIKTEIKKLEYTVLEDGENVKTAGTILYIAIISGLFTLLQKTGLMNLLVPSSIASSKMSYAVLFVTGLLTSVHCAAMCGGINLSQSLEGVRKHSLSERKKTVYIPAVLYNLGRLASYTLIGLVLGTAGFFLGGGSAGNAEIPLSVQGILKITAGIVMFLMGISLLGIFPSLKKFTPHLPAFLSKKITSSTVMNKAPFFVGFLNGFMPCGPLQAMWIVAIASASPLSGAFSMFFFSLGTVPLMLGLGSLVSFLGKKYTGVVMKIGAILVLVMSLSMLSQGFALAGWKVENLFARKNDDTKIEQIAKTQEPSKLSLDSGIIIENGKQIVKSKLNPYRYPSITVKKGIPVHWEIEADENSLNGCNYRMIFRDFGFQYQMDYGKNVIQFTPDQTGIFGYTCWMGMVRGTINVIE
ncbi:sulfite exporter TauE/SafE family protein [Treponema sp.]|uniref:urease accessory protein UreH domain-containing protein n=1 Tax=Treponema sp. TaxID=166 RepID=UPI0038902D5D